MSIKEFEHICGNINYGNSNKNNTDNPRIDNATSPSANLVIMFEVTPPGAAAIIITPIAISGGVFSTLVKSSSFKPNPKPSIINARIIGVIFVTISTLYITTNMLKFLYTHYKNKYKILNDFR